MSRGPLPKDPDRRQRGNTPVTRLELVERESLPEPAAEWTAWTVDAWDMVWRSAQASGWSDEQKHLVWLWAEALERYIKLQQICDAEPLIGDRFGQSRENPAHKMAKDAFRQMLELADRLAIPFKSKVSLGLKASVIEDRSLAAQAEKAKRNISDPRS